MSKTVKNGRQTFESIVRLRRKCEQEILTLNRRAKIGQEFLLALFSHPILNVKQVAKKLDISFTTANKLIGDFQKLDMLREITKHSRNRLFALHVYLDLFR